MTTANEQQLLQDAMAGDQQALGDLLESHQHRIYNVCLRMLTNRDDAAEIAQETMLKVVEHIGDFRGQARIGTWMIRIAMNLSISALRKRKVRQVQSLDAIGGGGDGGSGNYGDGQAAGLRQQLIDHREPGPDLNVQQSEMIAHLHTALGRIDDDFRAVLILRDMEQMDYRQIVGVLDIPIGTVKSRLFRARLALRRQMLKQTQRPPQPQAGTYRDG